jgi:hypothetical protein
MVVIPLASADVENGEVDPVVVAVVQRRADRGVPLRGDLSRDCGSELAADLALQVDLRTESGIASLKVKEENRILSPSVSLRC